MLFRIASHSVRERGFIGFESRSVDGDPFVEVVHLLLEVGCMFVVYVCFLSGFQCLDIPAEQQQVINT